MFRLHDLATQGLQALRAWIRPKKGAVAILPALLCFALPVAAAGEEARRIAVISLLGNKMTAITQQVTVGSRIDQNLQDSYDLPNGLLDSTVLVAVNTALTKSDAKIVPLMLKMPSPTVFGDPPKLFEGDRFVPPSMLDATLKQVKASHLLLVTPHRAPVNIQAERDGLGTGMLEGVGFYIDRFSKMQSVQNAQQSIGYLAPYTYYKLQLIDMNKGVVERQRIVARAVAVVSGKGAGVSDPWDILSSVEKVQVLLNALNETIAATVPALLLDTCVAGRGVGLTGAVPDCR